MVVGAFPAAKLGVLALKQISKPIANIIKNRAKNNPVFRTYVCMPPAQFYNWVEVKTKMWAMNLGKPMKVPQLNEAMAIDLGANLLGEFIIFTIGAGVLIFEYVRQSKKETKKEEQTLQEKIALKTAFDEMSFRLERQDAQMRELRRLLHSIETKSWIRRKIDSGEESEILKELDKEPSDTHHDLKSALEALAASLTPPPTEEESSATKATSSTVHSSSPSSPSNTSVRDLKPAVVTENKTNSVKTESSRTL